MCPGRLAPGCQEQKQRVCRASQVPNVTNLRHEGPVVVEQHTCPRIIGNQQSTLRWRYVAGPPLGLDQRGQPEQRLRDLLWRGTARCSHDLKHGAGRRCFQGRHRGVLRHGTHADTRGVAQERRKHGSQHRVQNVSSFPRPASNRRTHRARDVLVLRQEEGQGRALQEHHARRRPPDALEDDSRARRGHVRRCAQGLRINDGVTPLPGFD